MRRNRIPSLTALSHRFIWPLRDARLVHPAAKLALSEIAGRREHDTRIHLYTLKHSNLSLHLRQPWFDFWVFDEIFRREIYLPPPDVDAALKSLGRPPVIVDLGGHVGMATVYLLGHYPDARVTSFEPDPSNATILERTIAANALQDQWQLVRAAAGTTDGSVEFVTGTGEMGHLDVGAHERSGDGPAFAELGGVTTTVPMCDVFPYLAEADLIKLDIEGGEWSILQDERFASVRARAIVLEYHSFFGPPEPAQAIVDLLGAAGFRAGEPIEPRHDLGEGNLWAWRPDGG